jgi:hypothetical protein
VISRRIAIISLADSPCHRPTGWMFAISIPYQYERDKGHQTLVATDVLAPPPCAVSCGSTLRSRQAGWDCRRRRRGPKVRQKARTRR